MVWAGMQRCILCFSFFLILGGAEGLENGVELRNNSRIIFLFRLRKTERLWKEKERDGKEEREMCHSVCIVNTVDWGALRVLLFFLAARFV